MPCALRQVSRLVEEPAGSGQWRITKPNVAVQHRMNAGIIVDNRCSTCASRTADAGPARRASLHPQRGDQLFFAGLSLEVLQFKDSDILVQAPRKDARL
jgi:ATP-dependent Lhr-like helicase